MVRLHLVRLHLVRIHLVVIEARRHAVVFGTG
jgi:hypothetical protein